MSIVKCKNGSFDISEREMSFLKIYKSAATEEDFLRIYGYNVIHSSLTYKNINLFMNFLANPSNELLTKIEVDYIDKMVEDLKTLIDISCKYALNEGEIGERLYRYEDGRNLDGYMNGQLSSLKSTSIKPSTIKFDFGKGSTVPLVFKAPSFCPYIGIDNILNNVSKQSLFGFDNEAEYILPPYVDCILTDKYEYDSFHTDKYRIVHINGDYSDANPDKMMESYRDYSQYKNFYADLFNRDKSMGIVSEKLKLATRSINEYLKQYARCQYLKYNKLYNNKYNHDEVSLETNWPSEYRGIEEAITKYCSNQDSNKNWAASNELNVYALCYLIDSNFLPREELFKIYEKKDKEELTRFLKKRNDNSGYNPLSDSEYQEFIKLFNVSAGYGEEKPTKEEMIMATNKLACQDFIQENQDYNR